MSTGRRESQKKVRESVVGRFTALRKQFDLSQNQVAKDCKIPQTTISSWENPKVEAMPSTHHLIGVCNRYGWNPIYLFLGEGNHLLTTGDVTDTVAALQGQQLMLARVEHAVQEAMQEVRKDLLSRLEPVADAASRAVVRRAASPEPRRRHGSDGR